MICKPEEEVGSAGEHPASNKVYRLKWSKALDASEGLIFLASTMTVHFKSFYGWSKLIFVFHFESISTTG